MTAAGTKSTIGGKAASLRALTGAGLAVPRWSVLGAEVFDGQVSPLLDGLRPDTVDETAERVAALFADLTLDPDTVAAIDDAYAAAGGGLVAVRSSGAEEDGAEHSFAGQFHTALNVRGAAAVRDAVRACWASAYSARVLAYRLAHGLPARSAGMAVVLQEMVPARRSGVLFTADPTSGRREHCVVSAVYGLGESLVSGAVDADTVVVDRRDGTVVSSTVGDKAERLDAGGFSEVPAAERERLCLADGDLAGLLALATRVEELFGGPQDVEWAADDRGLWVLQSRPVTTLPPPPPAGAERIWDNSNIIESFSGVTSPLTYSFAADVYGRLYRAYAQSLRVPRRQLRQMDDWLPSMLGYFHGRVYYNLLHWYRMVRLAPGYPLTRRVLEISLGVAEPLPDEVADALHPFTHRTRLGALAATTVRHATFVRRFLRMDAEVDRFVADFYAAYAVFDDVDHDAHDGERIHRDFRDLERDLLERWGPLMALDAALLLSFGGLHLLTKRWLPDAPEWFQWAAVNPGEDVESAEPARAMSALAARVRADERLRGIVTDTPPERTRAALLDAGHDAFVAELDSYVDSYGYRSPDELKLEVPDLREDPAVLFVMLRDALPEAPDRRDDAVRSYLDAQLRGPRRWVYDRVRRRTSRLLAHRERLRFCRTRAFGSAKRMLRAMGRDLARAGAIARPEDVFLLRIDELRGAYDGTIGHGELPSIVALRRQAQEADHALHAPARFTTRGAPYWHGNLADWSTADAIRSGRTRFTGTPSSPGVAEARAVVTDRPVDVGGGVLVAYRTDPGWVAALPSTAGLVIERGSPLTHVAIVARELGVPTVVQVPGITRELTTGQRVRIDGGTGEILVLEDQAP